MSLFVFVLCLVYLILPVCLFVFVLCLVYLILPVCLFVFVLCLVYPMLPVCLSLSCVLCMEVSCIPNVASLFVFVLCLVYGGVLYTQCYQFVCLVSCVLCMEVSCIPNVTSFTVLTIPDCPFGFSNVYCYVIHNCCFVDRCLSFCTFSFGHSVVCSSLICRF